MNFDEYYRLEVGRYSEFVTQKEMCTILGICKSTAYSIQKKGMIPFELLFSFYKTEIKILKNIICRIILTILFCRAKLGNIRPNRALIAINMFTS